MQEQHVPTQNRQGLVSYKKWLKDVGVSDVTGWRWQKLGMLDEPYNINGRLYLSAKHIRKFNRRVAAGEFSKEHKAPPVPVAA